MFTESKNCLLSVLMAAVVLGAFLPGGSVASAAEKTMLPVLNYPHAGVSMAMPAGFTTHVVPDPSIVVRAGQAIARKPAQAVTLSAFCVGPKVTASESADYADKALKSQLAVRKFQSLKSVSIKVAGITGVARLLKYSYNGSMTTAARVFFVRELKGDDVHICYVLSVEVDVKYEKTLLPILDKVIKSVKLITLQSPASIPVRLSERKIGDYRGGFSIRVPEGWYGESVKGGVSVGQKNYLVGGANSPQITVLFSPVKPDVSSESLAKMVASKYLAATTRPDSGVELLSQGPAKVAGQDAYQYVLKLTYKVSPSTQPAATTSTSQPADKGTTSTSKPADKGKITKVGKIEAVRVVCRLDSSGKSVSACLFALSCMENEVKFVTSWLDTLGGGFEYLPPPDPAGKR